MSKPSYLPLICREVPIGSHAGVIITQDPWGVRVELDACIAAEIVTLWSHGIRTVSSCCGHSVADSFVEVQPQFCFRMEELRYVPVPGKANTFYTRSSQHGKRVTVRGRTSDSYDKAASKARAAGEKYYEGAPCGTCGGTKRYLSGHCVNYGDHVKKRKARKEAW